MTKLRRRPLALLFASSLLAAAGCDNTVREITPPHGPPAPTVRLATLNGAQAGTSSTAFGAGVLAVDTASGAVSGFVTTSGVVGATLAHVHLSAGRGVAGGVIVPLTGGPDLWMVPDGAGPLTAAQIDAFKAGALYFNVHTAANPTGEIRGQLDKTGTLALAALNGAQETPANASTAFGFGLLAVDPNTGAVAGFVSSSGLVSPTVAHVHLSSGRGVAGGAVVPLTVGPGLCVVPDAATALTAAQIAAFQAGTLYYNVHTTANPGGEIRGQLDKVGTVKLAALNGAQAGTSSSAFGFGLLSVNAASGAVAGFTSTAGLVSPTLAHVHQSAGRGLAGGVIVPMAAGPNLWGVPDGAAALTPAQIAGFAAGDLYFNVHTTANPTGEIRGQIDKLGAP